MPSKSKATKSPKKVSSDPSISGIDLTPNSTIIVPEKDIKRFDTQIEDLGSRITVQRKAGKDAFSAEILFRHLKSQKMLLETSATSELYQDVVKNIKRLTQQVESLEKEESVDIRKQFYDRT